MISQGLTTSFKLEMLQAQQNLATATLKLALYTATANLGPNTTAYTSEAEVVGTGYTAGGAPMTGTTIMADSNGTVYVSFNNVAFPGAAFVARGGLIYDSTNANKSVAVLDFGADRVFNTTNNTVTMPANTATTALIRFP